MRLGSILVVMWLLIGVVAAFQRDYFSNDSVDCAKAGTIALTVLAGPLNYLGVNPRTDCPAVDVDVNVPQPSQ